jgi:DtxR family transcriptional regulator, Mn-dependent transcriptional regulator
MADDNTTDEVQELSETLQNYIEAIYVIILEKNGVRVKDIAKRLGVKNSSVVSALRSLTKSEHINYEPYGIISLTGKGNAAARQLREKHRVLRHFFERILGMNRETAEESACKMEHSISEETFRRFTQFIKYIYVTYQKDPVWLEGFKEFYLHDPMSRGCEEDIDEYFEEVGGLSTG